LFQASPKTRKVGKGQNDVVRYEIYEGNQRKELVAEQVLRARSQYLSLSKLREDAEEICIDS
jgi:hypothetical protein